MFDNQDIPFPLYKLSAHIHPFVIILIEVTSLSIHKKRTRTWYVTYFTCNLSFLCFPKTK